MKTMARELAIISVEATRVKAESRLKFTLQMSAGESGDIITNVARDLVPQWDLGVSQLSWADCPLNTAQLEVFVTKKSQFVNVLRLLSAVEAETLERIKELEEIESLARASAGYYVNQVLEARMIQDLNEDGE